MDMNKNKVALAFDFASKKHASQYRKSSKLPYMVHIYDVAHILYRNSADETTIIAGILHDTLEDTDTTAQEISTLFGGEILQMVLEETENKDLSYKLRKQERIDSLKNADLKCKMIKCADMLSNITDIEADIKITGDNVWQKFNESKEVIKWYYESMIQSMKDLEECQDLKMYKQLKETFKQVFLANNI